MVPPGRTLSSPPSRAHALSPFPLSLLVTCALLLAAGARGQDLFSVGSELALVAPATALFSGDLDADGWSDLVVTHQSRASVSVLLNRSGTLFAEAATYEVGLGPLAVDGGDLDRDGDIDLVVANSGSSSISVLLNRGHGRFSLSEEIPVGLSTRVARLADFDGDGFPDAVTSNLVSHDLTILLGDGKGHLREAGRLDLHDEPHAIAVGDFDGDALPDVAAAHITDRVVGKLSVFRSVGDGSFEPPRLTRVEVSGGENLKWLVPGDFDGDGHVDLIAISEGGNLVLLENRGSGAFEPRLLDTGDLGFANPFLPSTPFLPFLIAADFTGDGHRDLIWPTERRGEFGFRVERGGGDGTFAHHGDIYLGTAYHLVALLDADRDGVLDVIAAVDEVPGLAIFLGSRVGEVDVRRTVELDAAPQDLEAFAGSAGSRGDLLAVSPDSLHWLRADTSGGFAPPDVIEFPGRGFQDAVVADFDGDGEEELALSDITGGTVAVISIGETGVEETSEHRVTDLPSKLIAAELDGDPLPDLAVTDHGAPNVTVLLRPGSEQAKTISVPVSSGQTAIDAADVDLDGAVDLIVGSRDGVVVAHGDGTGGFPRVRGVSAIRNSPAVRAADVDADGTIDLALVSRTRIVVLYAVATPETREEAIDIGSEIRPLAVRDVDGDGLLDLLTGSRNAVVALRGREGGRFGAPESYGVGLAPTALVLEDLDGDGRLDCAAANLSSWSVSVLRGIQGGGDGLFRRGDADSNGVVNLTDPVVLLDRLFGGRDPLGCPDAGDVNDDGGLDISDPVRLLRFLFVGEAAPEVPGPNLCGIDPTPDELDACADACR